MLVETRSLTKAYTAVTALANCSLGVARGEVFGLLGPNGSGKTTLLRLLLGYLRPTAGAAFIDGLDCFRQSLEVRARVAYLPSEARLFPTMRGSELLDFFASIRPGSDVRRSLAMAERLELDLSRKVSALSTGMKQKLALAAVLGMDTPLLILDEPTANLDPTVRSELLRIVREAQAAGRTVIFSSHVLDEVEQVCDRVCILRRGELVHVQVMSQLRRQHRIRAQLTAAMPAVPASLADGVKIRTGTNGDVTIETPGELSHLLGWLATLPLAEVQIEPYGLRAIYDSFHDVQAA